MSKKSATHITFSIPKKGLFVLGFLAVVAIPASVIATQTITNWEQHADVGPKNPPPGCYYGSNCLGSNDSKCQPILVCPNVTPTPPCQPLPPQCQPGSTMGIACPATPRGGWCHPAGCFYKPDYNHCPRINCSGNSCSCPQRLVCPTNVPQPSTIYGQPCSGEDCVTPPSYPAASSNGAASGSSVNSVSSPQ